MNKKKSEMVRETLSLVAVRLSLLRGVIAPSLRCLIDSAIDSIDLAYRRAPHCVSYPRKKKGAPNVS